MGHRPEEKEELLKTIRLVMPVLCRALTSKLQQFDPSRSKAIPDLLSKFLQFQVGNRVVYDLLAVEFARHLNTYSLRDKCAILDSLATADIDAAGAIRTAHAVCASVFEAFRLQLIDQSLQDPLENVDQYIEQLQQSIMAELPEGLYTGDQVRFITAAREDISTLQHQIAKRYAITSR